MKRIAKALIYDKDGKLLVLRRSETHPRFPHAADLPGGEIDEGEDVVTGLIREIKEETGMNVPESYVNFALRQQTRVDRTDELYVVHLNTSMPKIQISWEHESYSWIANATAKDLDTSDRYMPFVAEYLSKKAN